MVLAIGSGADAAYAAHLAGAVPGVRVIQEVRDLHDALVLDVQCDASRPDDEAAVAIATEHARATSVPIVVTRHGEVARALACDAVADVIVAFDEAASARLRRWWPQTPVVCIDVLTDDSARQHADVWQSLSPARGGQTCLRPI